MVLNALDEVLFWEDIGSLKDFIGEISERYYPHDYDGYRRAKKCFFDEHIPHRDEFIRRLEIYADSGAPVWVAGRNRMCDDITLRDMRKAILVSSKPENGESKAARACEFLASDPDFWDFYVSSTLYAEENRVLELTVGAGAGTNAVMRGMNKEDLFFGVDIDFVCAKNADAIAAYYGANGLGIAASLWNLPFDDEMFTSVCSNQGLEECREIYTVLAEAMRVLISGGRLVLHCVRREKSLWYSYFEEYGFSSEEAEYWLRRVRLFSDIGQIKEAVGKLGGRLIGQRFDEGKGYIVVFEKV